MSDKIITADEAKALAAKWRRLDGPYSVSWDDEGDCVIHCEDTTIARVAHIDGGYTELLARLFAAAPDDVKRLAATVVTLCDAAAHSVAVERERHAAELDELHALVAAQAAILTGVANALRGPPGPLASHGHADLAERAARVVGERDRATALNAEDATMIRDLLAAVEGLRRERDRLQRACDEGLPRERIACPACGLAHVEGPRHDDPSVDGRTRPHHTHRCYHCGHVWDAGRWSFGVAEGGR